jgi:rhomboid protease GluP
MIPPRTSPESPRASSIPIPLARPRWTFVILAINIIVYVAMFIVATASGVGGGVVSGDGRITPLLVDFGANVAPAVAEGQYWRLLTANFVHVGLVHLLVNSWALYALGTQVESLFGHPRFIVIYILSGIAGAVLSYVITHGISAGASTSLFGLFGALVVYFYKHREMLGSVGQQQLVNLAITLAINVFFGIAPGSRIDNAGHAGGFIGGLALAWFLCPRYARVDPISRAFESALPASRKPELANAQLMDTNSLPQQTMPVTVVAVALILLTVLGTSLPR